MPSPFPGMDPFLEGAEWPGFHVSFIVELQHALAPRVQPKYVVLVERRIYLERHLSDDDQPPISKEPQQVVPDVSIVRTGSSETRRVADTQAPHAQPVLVTLPMPEEELETWVTVRLRDTRRVVTVIELLSPANKQRGSDGRREYLEKRASILKSREHLVEIDLLRGGARLPTIEGLPAADYYVLVSRASQRPRAEAFPFTLHDAMPTIPVPLLSEDGSVSLDLQSVFTETYERTGYAYSLDYDGPVAPPLPSSESSWLDDILAGRRAGP